MKRLTKQHSKDLVVTTTSFQNKEPKEGAVASSFFYYYICVIVTGHESYALHEPVTYKPVICNNHDGLE